MSSARSPTKETYGFPSSIWRSAPTRCYHRASFLLSCIPRINRTNAAASCLLDGLKSRRASWIQQRRERRYTFGVTRHGVPEISYHNFTGMGLISSHGQHVLAVPFLNIYKARFLSFVGSYAGSPRQTPIFASAWESSKRTMQEGWCSYRPLQSISVSVS